MIKIDTRYLQQLPQVCIHKPGQDRENVSSFVNKPEQIALSITGPVASHLNSLNMIRV